jgi:AraC-like DNA-binding protein
MEIVSLERLADLAGLSPFHLTRIFRREVGLPPHVYLKQVRVFKARQLLDQGLAIAEAAAEAGFTDQSHLSRQFKKLLGITPGQYRRLQN